MTVTTKPTTDTLLTIKQVAAHLQVCPRTVQRLIKAGDLPALRVRRQWRVRELDLRRFLFEQQLRVQAE
jgi:excisionase family DNA binding protein